jgi:hypothetical protein
MRFTANLDVRWAKQQGDFMSGLSLTINAYTTQEIHDILNFHDRYPHTGMQLATRQDEELCRDLTLDRKCKEIIKEFNLPISEIELVRISRSIILGSHLTNGVTDNSKSSCG